MHIEAVDFFYLSMPEVLDISDGSQDALLVRIVAGGYTGWGECEAAPLVSIASLVCPMSHSACKPVRDSVLGQRLDGVADIRRIGDLVRENSLDLLQAAHTLSGIDIALWDLLGQRWGEPVYRLLGYERAYPKLPYASMLFGATAAETYAKARQAAAAGFRAAKFGWEPFGRTTPEADGEHIAAIREGLGPEGVVLIDAGTVWYDDVAAATARAAALREYRVTWLEEPFVSGATAAYRELAGAIAPVKLAGGEGCHTYWMALQMLESAGLGYVQIDAGRIGGISVAKQVADAAQARNITFVNHTFTSHLALSASLQPYAGIENDAICEYPAELSPLAVAITQAQIPIAADGTVTLPDAPGLGMQPDLQAIAPYLVDVDIVVNGKVLYRTPQL